MVCSRASPQCLHAEKTWRAAGDYRTIALTSEKGGAVVLVWYCLVNRNLQLAFALNNLDEMRQHQVLDDVHPARQDVPHNVEHGVK